MILRPHAGNKNPTIKLTRKNIEIIWLGSSLIWVHSVCNTWEGPEGGGGGDRVRHSDPTPPEKSEKYRVSLQYWSGSPEKSQSYQASI